MKFRKASNVTSELASVASVASSTHFERQLELLTDLTTHWKNGDEVANAEIDDGMCTQF